MSYYQLLSNVARAIAANHGYIFGDVDILRLESARAYLFTSDAEVTLELIDEYLTKNGITFADLEVAKGYRVDNSDQVPTSPQLDWVKLTELVDKLYLAWGVTRASRSTFEQYELDKIEAILDAFSHQEVRAIYHDVYSKSGDPVFGRINNKPEMAKAIWQMLNPYPGQLELTLYFNSNSICIGAEAADRWASSHNWDFKDSRKITIRAGFNPLNRSLIDILQYNTDQAFGGSLPAAEPAPEVATVQVEDIGLKARTISIDPQFPTLATIRNRAKSISKDCSLEYALKLESHDDLKAQYDCLMSTATNPIKAIKSNKHDLAVAIITMLEAKEAEATPAPAAEPAPAPTRHGPQYKDVEPAKELPADFFDSCTKAQRELYQNSFVGREKAFKEFLQVKRELEGVALNIRVGKMTASQSTAKSWNVNGGEAGTGKCALFWDLNGWTIGPRTVDGELPEGLEGWELMDHLADNNVYANGLHASHWYDAIDEEAEAEAVAAQLQEKMTKAVSDFYKRH